MTDIYEKRFQHSHKLIGKETQQPEPVEQPKAREIEVYLRSESTIEFWHGGCLVDKRSTYNDYYGHETSIREAIQDAETYCEKYSITPHATLEVIVRTKWYEVRRYADGKQEVRKQMYPDPVKEAITWVSPNADQNNFGKYMPAENQS